MVVSGKDNFSEKHSIEEIALTSQKLCEDYIHARLRRSGISDFDMASTMSYTDCSLTLLAMGQILELRYPKLFSQVSTHLGITFGNEAVVWGAFNKFAANLFINGTTWARIIALFAFAGGLAVDCVAHGRAIFLGRIGHWLACFVGKTLAIWIKRHGGWDDLVSQFSKTEQESKLQRKSFSVQSSGLQMDKLIALLMSFVAVAVAACVLLW